MILLLVAVMAVMPIMAFGDMTLLERLDRVMADSSKYMSKKEALIQTLCKQAEVAPTDSLRMRLYNDIYAQYYTYRYDSAMAYVERLEALATRVGNSHYAMWAAIHRSVLLSTVGLYSEAIDNLGALDEAVMDREMRFAYYFSYAWAYNYRSSYCQDKVYAPLYRTQKQQFLQKAISLAPDYKSREYLVGEYLYERGEYQKSYRHYMNAYKRLPVDTRLYAMATYAIARYHLLMGNSAGYEEFIVKAAISDIVCPLKENLAMQELAMYLYRNMPGEINRAHRYINYSMNDALFYHNRLRIIQIGNKLPYIVSAYQQVAERQRGHLLLMLVCISLLLVGLAVSLFFLRKQLRLSHAQRKQLALNNERLSSLNMNLRDTNAVRERYVRLFLDLCAAYIDKLAKYRSLVVRKIKARQAEDLLKASHTSRLAEQDAASFFVSFDAAFLELYPTFVDEFNNLLQEEARIVPKEKGSLTTVLRIFALIRLGVKDSSEIATLLFYSPQTIYNYRSAIKNNAKNRDTFEDDVTKLCLVV